MSDQGAAQDQRRDFSSARLDTTAPSGSMERRFVSSGSVTTFSSSLGTGALYLILNEGPSVCWFRSDGTDPDHGYGLQADINFGIPIGPGQSFDLHQPLEPIAAGSLKFSVSGSGGSATITLYRSSRNL